MSDTSIPRDKLVNLYRSALKQGVELDQIDHKVDRYVSQVETTEKKTSQQEQEREKEMKQQLPLAVRITAWALPVIFLGIGLYLIGSAAVPIALAFVQRAPALAKNKLAAPIPSEEVIDIVPSVMTASSVGADSQLAAVEPRILDVELDYTNLSNWFNDPAPELKSGDQEDYYYIDIPSLDIEQAKVGIGGTDLNKSLIQYPGTAKPGERGAPVIFGHSVLRQFYNPSLKNPRRYNSIFSYIMTLEPGDKIYVTHQGAKYTYVVTDKTEVKPEDTYILSQQHNVKALKLVTCTPEGTYLRRGVITAQLVEG